MKGCHRERPTQVVNYGRHTHSQRHNYVGIYLLSKRHKTKSELLFLMIIWHFCTLIARRKCDPLLNGSTFNFFLIDCAAFLCDNSISKLAQVQNLNTWFHLQY